MRGQYDVLVTMDRGLEFQQRISTLPFGIILVRARSNRIEDLKPLAPSILSALDAISLAAFGELAPEQAASADCDRHRHLRVRIGQRRLHRIAVRLLHLHGRRLRPQPRPRRHPNNAFAPSLFVSATVMSRPTDDRAIVDAGLKALAFDSGPPRVCDEPAATYERASDERGRLAVGHGPQSRRFILTASRYAVYCIGDSILRRQADRGVVRRSGCSRLSRDCPPCEAQARSGQCGEQNN